MGAVEQWVQKWAKGWKLLKKIQQKEPLFEGIVYNPEEDDDNCIYFEHEKANQKLLDTIPEMRELERSWKDRAWEFNCFDLFRALSGVHFFVNGDGLFLKIDGEASDSIPECIVQWSVNKDKIVLQKQSFLVPMDAGISPCKKMEWDKKIKGQPVSLTELFDVVDHHLFFSLAKNPWYYQKNNLMGGWYFDFIDEKNQTLHLTYDSQKNLIEVFGDIHENLY